MNLLGIDLGTSGVKALVLSPDGSVLGAAGAEYPVRTDHSGWAETDPADWWSATVTAVRAALARGGLDGAAEPVGAVGLSGQMHGLVLAASSGAPVRRAMLWADTRAAAQVARWRGLTGAARRRLANPLVPGMTGPLLRWLVEHEPASLSAARWALLPKDWLRLRLTGAAASDPSDASATLLWDVPADEWANDLFAALGVPGGPLPEARGSASAAGELAPAAARELGISPNIPVATGAADTAAALLATGLDAGEVQVNIGTGAQVVALTDRPETAGDEPVAHLYRTAEPRSWYRMAAVQNAGLALDWVRELLGASWDELYGSVSGAEPGAGGVSFVPYLTGERTPVIDPSATASLHGLTLASDRRAVLQASVEGVAFAIRDAAEALPGELPPRLRLAGGGSRHPLFRQLLADVLGAELWPAEVRDASAIGAALLAARAAGEPEPGSRGPGGPSAGPAGEPVAVPGERAAGYAAAYARYRHARSGA